MWKDPIVEEVRKVREEHAAKFDFDIKAIIEDAQRRQTKSKHPVVSLARKEQSLMVESREAA
ncbi:hypothetical protein KJ693_12280 [bacterium]|nr:hypothetical protein [bacterium]MBU1616070.1 hypothetical protein [bacterium]